MVKYVDTDVTFAEFPQEIALCINISGCKNACPNCHSSYLANDIGEVLDQESLLLLLEQNQGVTCVGFMGGDQDPNYIMNLAKFVKEKYPKMKVGWYSGKQELPKDLNITYLDYYKLGPYIEEYGPLNSPTTNQRFYARGNCLGKLDGNPNMFYDITDRFYNKEDYGTR